MSTLRYTVEIVNHKEGITDITPINTIITVVGFLGLAITVAVTKLGVI